MPSGPYSQFTSKNRHILVTNLYLPVVCSFTCNYILIACTFSHPWSFGHFENQVYRYSCKVQVVILMLRGLYSCQGKFCLYWYSSLLHVLFLQVMYAITITYHCEFNKFARCQCGPLYKSFLSYIQYSRLYSLWHRSFNKRFQLYLAVWMNSR